MKNIKTILKILMFILMLLLIPIIVINGVDFFTHNGVSKNFVLIQNRPNDRLSFSEFLQNYISVLGIEATACLTLVLYKLSNDKSKMELKQKRYAMYCEISVSLKYLFKLYCNSICNKPTGIDTYQILVTKDYSDRIDSLQLNDVNLLNCKKMCNVIYEIKEAKKYDVEKFDNLFRMITYEFFVYFKRDIISGENVNIGDIINVDFQSMFHELNPKVYKSKTMFAYYKDEKTELFVYDYSKNKYMVYDYSDKMLCYCVFKDYEPYDGRSVIYKNDVLYFNGEISNGKLTSGTFYHCRMGEDESPVLNKDNYPVIVSNSDNDNSKNSFKNANFLYDGKDYIAFSDSVKWS